MFLNFQLSFVLSYLRRGHCLKLIILFLDPISLGLDLYQFFSGLISIFISIPLFQQLFVSTSLKTFYSLVEIPPGVHFQALLLPFSQIRWNDHLKQLHFFIIRGFLIQFLHDEIFSDNLHNIQLLPQLLYTTPRQRFLLIINNKSFPWPGNRSIQKLQFWAQLSIIIDISKVGMKIRSDLFDIVGIGFLIEGFFKFNLLFDLDGILLYLLSSLAVMNW